MPQTEEQRKSRLRAAVRRRRNRLSKEDIETKSQQIAKRVLRLRIWQEAEVVLGYCAFDSEVRTDRLLEAALQQGKRVVLPRVNRQDKSLDLYYVLGLDGQWLAPGTWGILEPLPHRCEPASPNDLELVLVPGVAFDAVGGRIGYGGGYYDRLLNSLRPDQQRRVVALAFEDQIVEDVPLSFFDFRVPIIVTNRRIINTFT
jgi:5-formyltetrahydrofolate cyclo-ligase